MQSAVPTSSGSAKEGNHRPINVNQKIKEVEADLQQVFNAWRQDPKNEVHKARYNSLETYLNDLNQMRLTQMRLDQAHLTESAVPNSSGSPEGYDGLAKLDQKAREVAATLQEMYDQWLLDPKNPVLKARCKGLEKRLKLLNQMRLNQMRLDQAHLTGLAAAGASATGAGGAAGGGPVALPGDQTKRWLRDHLAWQGVVPSIQDLESYFLDGLSSPHTRPRLPVLDAIYRDLVEDDPEMEGWLEPLSKSNAVTLAVVVWPVIKAKRWTEPGSEYNLAGLIDKVLHDIIDDACLMLDGPRWHKHRDDGWEGALISRELRPDYTLLVDSPQGARLIMKGEDRGDDSELPLAITELGQTMKAWSAVYFGKVPYLPCYAAAGLQLQYCYLPAAGRQQPPPPAVCVGDPIDLRERAGRCLAIHMALRLLPVLMGLAKLLPSNSTPLAATRSYYPATTIFFGSEFIVKTTNLPLAAGVPGAFDSAQAELMPAVYSAAAGCPHLIQATSEVRYNLHEYSVMLSPAGHPLNEDSAPRGALLQEAIRSILFALAWLHASGIGHGDLRWHNVIERLEASGSSEAAESLLDSTAAGSESAAVAKDQPLATDASAKDMHPALLAIPPNLRAAAVTPGRFLVTDLEGAVKLGTLQAAARVRAIKGWDDGAALTVERCFTERSDLYMVGRMMQRAAVVANPVKGDNKVARDEFMGKLLQKELSLEEALLHSYMQKLPTP